MALFMGWDDLAHNTGTNEAPDHLGSGEAERNPAPSEDWRKPKLLPGQSKGFLRAGQLDDNIVPFSRTNADTEIQALEPNEDSVRQDETMKKSARSGTLQNVATVGENASSASSDAVKTARFQGYTGDACPECGHFTLIRNGTCQKCDTCGTTTGCS